MGSGGIAPPFLISALDGGEGSAVLTALLPENERLTPIGFERPGGTQSRFERCGEKKDLAPAGIRIPVFQPVARRYTD
jgi:hypothetical protein